MPWALYLNVTAPAGLYMTALGINIFLGMASIEPSSAWVGSFP
jgi:hypothetical protein